MKESALKVLDELHRRLGEDYMPLLPDTVPFLAELMEGRTPYEKELPCVLRKDICFMEKQWRQIRLGGYPGLSGSSFCAETVSWFLSLGG